MTLPDPAAPIGLLRNLASTRNARAGGTERLPEGVVLRAPSSISGIEAALAELRDAGIGLLVIDGGDGTVREVLTRVAPVWGGARPPAIAILAHGNTNLIARKAGLLRGAEGLAAVVAAMRAGRLRARRIPVLEVARPGLASVRGFIAGWGAYETGTRLAAEEIAARGGGQVIRAVAATLRRALVGGEAAALRRGIEAALAVDGEALPPGRRLVGLVTTLPGGLVAGMRPFWGGGEGRLRWLDIAAPGRWLALAAPFVLAGRPRAWMRRAGYRSGRAARLDLRLDAGAGLIVDGERFAPGEGGRVTLSAHDEVVLVMP